MSRKKGSSSKWIFWEPQTISPSVVINTWAATLRPRSGPGRWADPAFYLSTDHMSRSFEGGENWTKIIMGEKRGNTWGLEERKYRGEESKGAKGKRRIRWVRVLWWMWWWTASHCCLSTYLLQHYHYLKKGGQVVKMMMMLDEYLTSGKPLSFWPLNCSS